MSTKAQIVPQYLYHPLYHSAVMLKASTHPTGARALLKFLRQPKALKIIHDYGFRTPDQLQEHDD